MLIARVVFFPHQNGVSWQWVNDAQQCLGSWSVSEPGLCSGWTPLCCFSLAEDCWIQDCTVAGRAATSALLKLGCKSWLITLHPVGLWVFPFPFSPVQPEVRATPLQKAKSIKKVEVYVSCVDACAQHWLNGCYILVCNIWDRLEGFWLLMSDNACVDKDCIHTE